jgi:hypothetical protein
LSVESFDLNNATIFPEQSMSNLGNPSVSFLILRGGFMAVKKNLMLLTKQN